MSRNAHASHSALLQNANTSEKRTIFANEDMLTKNAGHWIEGANWKKWNSKKDSVNRLTSTVYTNIIRPLRLLSNHVLLLLCIFANNTRFICSYFNERLFYWHPRNTFRHAVARLTWLQATKLNFRSWIFHVSAPRICSWLQVTSSQNSIF